MSGPADRTGMKDIIDTIAVTLDYLADAEMHKGKLGFDAAAIAFAHDLLQFEGARLEKLIAAK